MTHRAEPESLRLAAAGALVVCGVLVAAAWSLSATPTVGSATSTLRVLSTCAAVAVLGVSCVPYLAVGGLRIVIARRAARWLPGVGAVWLVAEVARVGVNASDAAGVAVADLPIAVLRLYSLGTEPGRASVVAVASAGLLCAAAVRGPSPVAGLLAAVGIASRASSGHVSYADVGVASVALHAVAAGVWCGLLAAMTVTVRRRAEWAVVLPRFSVVASVCVGVLLASGAVAGFLLIGTVSDLYRTPHGRLLVTKMLLTCALLAFGWRNRRWWVPRARAGTISAGASGRRALGELAVMGGALGAAAILATTA